MCRTPTSQLQCEVPVGHHTALKARARSFAKRFEKCRSRVVQELQCLQVSRSGRYYSSECWRRLSTLARHRDFVPYLYVL
ncbi:hypothetical protein JG688_00012691 [Phytophthora aleatoria]|uniref:Uncharacterized protein n=1 Tax=Phytophthora aleatoria TaxID=2496075 RepID=A0A8J5J2M0_9STRA|nr:hypothetical protein JG688_00012691 [Phytophthora aleatoria]